MEATAIVEADCDPHHRSDHLPGRLAPALQPTLPPAPRRLASDLSQIRAVEATFARHLTRKLHTSYSSRDLWSIHRPKPGKVHTDWNWVRSVCSWRTP